MWNFSATSIFFFFFPFFGSVVLTLRCSALCSAPLRCYHSTYKSCRHSHKVSFQRRPPFLPVVVLATVDFTSVFCSALTGYEYELLVFFISFSAHALCRPASLSVHAGCARTTDTVEMKIKKKKKKSHIARNGEEENTPVKKYI